MQTWVQGFVSVLREGHGKCSVANASLEVLSNPSMLIQAQHDRLLLIPLPFAWFETASLTTMLLPIYSIPLHLEESQRCRASHSELLNREKILHTHFLQSSLSWLCEVHLHPQNSMNCACLGWHVSQAMLTVGKPCSVTRKQEGGFFWN